MIKVKDGIGPHEGIEIELLLANQKNIAYFETLPDNVLPHINNGALQYKVHHLPLRKEGQLFAMTAHFVYRHGHDDALHELIDLLSKKFDLNVERRIGQILGYSEKSIDMYIKHATSITPLLKGFVKQSQKNTTF